MKIIRYIWAMPNTLLGLIFVPLALFTKGRMEIVDGVLEIHGGIVSWILNRCIPSRGYVGALTLGHVVLGYNEEFLNVYRRHEHAHVRQYEMFGPLFIPVYIAAGIYALIRGRDAYNGNYLERKALEYEKEVRHGKKIK